MAIVTKTRTYNTGDVLPAGYYNADRDEIIAGVNSIDNAQVSPTAGILESKIAFNIGGGHHHDGIDSRLIQTSWSTMDYTGLTANYPVFINATADGLQTHLILPTDLDPTFLLPEAQVTFDPVSGHIHDGVTSTKVPVGNLNPLGLTPLEFVRVDATGSFLETAPVTATTPRTYVWFFPGFLNIANYSPIFYMDNNITTIGFYAQVRVAPTGSSIIMAVYKNYGTGGQALLTNISILATQTTAAVTLATPLVIGDTVTVVLLGVGSTTTGNDLTVTMVSTL